MPDRTSGRSPSPPPSSSRRAGKRERRPTRSIRPIWAEEFESVGGRIDPDGTVLLYHATTRERADEIRRDGVLRRPADAPDSYGVYVSSSTSVGGDYGDGTVVPVRVRVEDITPDDVFPGRRLDFRAPTIRGIYRPVAVGPSALRTRPPR